MSDNATTVRVKTYTKELISKHSKKQKLTQNDLIEKAILVAEKMNFEYELPLQKIEKSQVHQTNRMIGFLKTQDKNMAQMEQNIYNFFNQKLREDRREILEYFYIKTYETIDEICKKYYIAEDEETAPRKYNIFMERFRMFFAENYKVLLNDIDELK